MKANALLALLLVALGAAVAPSVYGFEGLVAQSEAHLRRLEESTAPEPNAEDNNQPADMEGDEDKEQFFPGGDFPGGGGGFPGGGGGFPGGGGGFPGGGFHRCFPGSWGWPHCRFRFHRCFPG
ncbi:hypothetical protein BBJ28_00020644, partial [Nothophytophthora sp. Chile5]